MNVEPEDLDCALSPRAEERLFGDFTVEPWPSLQMFPYRSQSLGAEIVRATPGTRYWPFAETIPGKVRDWARKAPSFSWGMVELCAAASSRGRELVESCPALAVLVLGTILCRDSGRFYQELRTLREHSAMGLLHDVGVPARRGVFRLLAKIPIEHCARPSLDRLRALLRNDSHPRLKVLSHLGRITRDTVQLLTLSPAMVSPRLLLESSASLPDEEPIYWTLCSVQSLRKELGCTAPWPYRQLSFDRLRLVEGRLFDQTNPADWSKFPPPPIPGRAGLRPLTTLDAVLVESEGQNNCAAAYAADIAAGRVYIYALHHPERATIALRRDAVKKTWTIQEIRGAGNANVAHATTAYVRRWFTHMIAQHTKQQ